jgi:taurine--2-oxoglutarate transaminase
MSTHDRWQQLQRDGLLFTWTAQRGVRGLEIDDARGARFHVAGKGWVWDLESQTYNVNVGHKNPHVVGRMIEQIETLPAAAPHAILPVRAKLARLLQERTGFAKAFLTTGGSEAVENAIKLALLLTGRGKIVTRRCSYHGATLAALGVAGDSRRDAFASFLPQPCCIDDPYPPRQATTDRASDWVDSFEALLAREGPGTIAAVLLEGLTGTNGMQIPPVDFWPRVREACDEHGILLIDDEIFSGFGRTGRWFAHEHHGARPDMMVIGKGLTSGYAPLAGVMVSERIARHFDDNMLPCGLTHYAHPVSCAAAVGSIEVLASEQLPENAHAVGKVLAERLRALAAQPDLANHIRDVRGLGLMRLLELDRPTGPLAQALWDLGVYAPFRNDTLMLCPPLCITEEEMRQVADLVDEAVRAFLIG